MGHEDSTLSKSLNLLELGVRGKTRAGKWEKDGAMRGGVAYKGYTIMSNDWTTGMLSKLTWGWMTF